MTNLDGVVAVLKKEHARLTKQVEGVSAALKAFGAVYSNGLPRKRGKMSAAGRARIAEAQRQRWAKLRNATGAAKKRKALSAAARKKISLAQKARWAKQRKNT
jgi:hypothetical protein